MSVTKILDRHIEITPGIAGGKPRIANHRITVQNIVIWHERMGLSADEIAAEYGLTLADVYAALAYYYDNRSEIDADIRADEAFVAELRKSTPSRSRCRFDLTPCPLPYEGRGERPPLCFGEGAGGEITPLSS